MTGEARDVGKGRHLRVTHVESLILGTDETETKWWERRENTIFVWKDDQGMNICLSFTQDTAEGSRKRREAFDGPWKGAG